MFHPYSFYLQKHKNAKSNESLPSHFQLPLITSPRYPYPQCPKPPFIMSQTTIWGIPFCHLGYPISPFGVYFRHICAQRTAPMPDLASSFFAAKACAFSFQYKKIDPLILLQKYLYSNGFDVALIQEKNGRK